MSRKLWVVALIVWFALYAVLALTNIVFVGSKIALGLIALAVAILAVFDK